MDFALFSHIPWPEEHTPKRLYSDLTEQAIIGEELGFKAIWLAEHHFTRYGLGASSLVIASNIAARTNHIRLGTAVLIPPLHHPVRLAEDTATLDVLSDGRLDVGFGRGAAASEYVNFGVDHAESQARYRETIEMVESLWTTPDYSFEGDYYSAHRLNLVPTPLQQPHPPVYVAATRSVESLEFVSTTGRRLIIGVVLNTGEAVELLKRFLDMAQQSGSPVTAAAVPFSGISTSRKPRRRRTGMHAMRSTGPWTSIPGAPNSQWAARFTNGWTITGELEPSFLRPTNSWLKIGHSSAALTNAPSRSRHFMMRECATSVAISPSAACPTKSR